MPENDTIPSAVQAAVARHSHDAANLVQILHDVQNQLGHIPEQAVDQVARVLGIPPVKVAGVRGFYHFFHDRPHGRYDILFSDNIIEHFQGKQELLNYICTQLWVEPERVSEDGMVRVGSTSCIGMSDQGPAALVNGLPVTRLTMERVTALVDLVKAGKPPAEWPAEFFQVADNLRRADALLGEPLERGAGVRAVLEKGADGMLAEIDKSGLRGRGGAGFKTAVKWDFCRKAVDTGAECQEVGGTICDNTAATVRYVVCNADEGEPGTFKDRVLLNSYADLVFEGMTVAARVIGARQGFLYLRGEYRYLLDKLNGILEQRRRDGLLGERILGTDFSFDIAIHLGAGAYICGEESALIESLEGKRGTPRNRPPFPVTHGYLGKPTVVNNVETYASAAKVAAKGGEWFAQIGTAQSTGTKVLSISGDCERPGVYEYPFGVTVRQVLADCGAKDIHAVQVGGPSGTIIGEAEFDRKIAFEDLATGGSMMVFGQGRDVFEAARNFAHFFAHESCGFCTPCRVGSRLIAKGMDKIASGHGTCADVEELKRLGHLTRTMSHCGLGQTAANPVMQTLEKFWDHYDKRLRSKEFEPSFDLDKALETARKITGRDDAWAHISAD